MVAALVQEERLQGADRLLGMCAADGDEVGAAHRAVADALAKRAARAVEVEDGLRRALGGVVLAQRLRVLRVQGRRALGRVALTPACGAWVGGCGWRLRARARARARVCACVCVCVVGIPASVMSRTATETDPSPRCR